MNPASLPVMRTFELPEPKLNCPMTMEALADCWYKGNHAEYGRTQHYNDSRYHMLYGE